MVLQISLYGTFFNFIKIGYHFFCKPILSLKEHTRHIQCLPNFFYSEAIVQYILTFYV